MPGKKRPSKGRPVLHEDRALPRQVPRSCLRHTPGPEATEAAAMISLTGRIDEVIECNDVTGEFEGVWLFLDDRQAAGVCWGVGVHKPPSWPSAVCQALLRALDSDGVLGSTIRGLNQLKRADMENRAYHNQAPSNQAQDDHHEAQASSEDHPISRDTGEPVQVQVFVSDEVVTL